MASPPGSALDGVWLFPPVAGPQRSELRRPQHGRVRRPPQRAPWDIAARAGLQTVARGKSENRPAKCQLLILKDIPGDERQAVPRPPRSWLQAAAPARPPRSPEASLSSAAQAQPVVQPLTHEVAPAWSPGVSLCWRPGLAGAGGDQTLILLRGGVNPAENRKRTQFGLEPALLGIELIEEEPRDAGTKCVGVKAPQAASCSVSVRSRWDGRASKISTRREQEAKESAIRF